jgi:hypothetical protein
MCGARYTSGGRETWAGADGINEDIILPRVANVERLLLKTVLQEIGWYTNCIQLVHAGPNGVCCEHGNKQSDSMKSKEFLGQLSDYQHLQKDCTSWTYVLKFTYTPMPFSGHVLGSVLCSRYTEFLMWAVSLAVSSSAYVWLWQQCPA